MKQQELSGLARSLRTDLARVDGTNGQWFEVIAADLSPTFRTTQSGLIVPARYARHDSLEHVYTYLTPPEILGFEIPLEYVVARMRMIPVRDALAFAARIMAELRQPGRPREQVDRHYAGSWFTGPARTRILSLLGGPERRILIVPQAVMFLVKLALLVSPDEVEDPVPGELVVCLVAANGLIGNAPTEPAETVIGASPGLLGRELISNQHFNAELDGLHLMARFFHRWMLDGEGGLEKIYRSATGVPILDVMTAGMVIWSRAVKGDVIIPIASFFEEGWSTGRTEAALDVLAAPIDELRSLVRDEIEEFGIEWAVSTFERFPVVRADGHLLCLDLAYLVRRCFGWPLYWDVMNGLAGNKDRGSFDSTIRFSAERYVRETFENVCGDPDRVYGDEQLKSRLSMSKSKVADVAVDYGDCWIVAEITTSVLRRQSVAGVSDEDVEQDLDKLVKKVAQIDSTICQLRTNSRKLTGHPGPGRVSFLPVLVLAEGFPVNPISLTVMRERVRQAGLLHGKDVAPLEMLDTIEIEMVESLQESAGPDLRTLLEGKRSADLALMSMRDYILIELDLEPPRSSRVDRLWRQVFDLIIAPFRPAQPADAAHQ